MCLVCAYCGCLGPSSAIGLVYRLVKFLLLFASSLHHFAEVSHKFPSGLNRLTYKDFEKNINAMAHGVQRTLFTPKHKIVIWAKDCAENVVAQLGAAKGGVQVQVLGAGASAAELEKALSDARALLFSPTLLPEEGAYKMVKKLIPELEGLEEENGGGDILYSAKFPDLRWVFNTGFERYPGMIKFAYVLNPIRQAPAVTKPGTITFTGPGESISLSVPHLDPDAKMPIVESSNEIA
jgi:hypothetical protein